MNEWYGYAGRILRIDLSRKKIVKAELDKGLAKAFIGGRGINSKILFDELNPGIDAFSPDNPLIFGVGPLIGTLSPSSGRYTVSSKSPLTGILGDANSGGFWAPELKYAGYDHIVIKGLSSEPVYLWIDDDCVEIRNAKHLWGLDTWQTDKAIKQEIGDNDIQIACIGQAGENLVRYACIINNLARAAGRTGMGAVMGSKRLKAIAVRGSKDVRIAKPKEFEKAIEKAKESIKSDEGYEPLRRYGTPLLVNLLNEVGSLGVKNMQEVSSDEADKVSGETLLEKYVVRHKGCFGCMIQCSRFYSVQEGEYKNTYAEKLEYAPLQALGPSCGNFNLASIVYANKLINMFGMDGITVGVTIAWAMECYEKGLITKEDTDGLDLSWGNHKAIIELIEKIAKREGFGKLLAEGSVIASEKLGKGKEYAFHMKRNPHKGNDMRSRRGGALAFVTATRGSDHLRGMPLIEQYGHFSPEFYQELYGIKEVGDMTSTIGKAPLVIWNENLCALTDAIGMCKFPTAWLLVFKGIRFKQFAEIFSAATGVSMDEAEMIKVGERIYNVERAFNVREGITRKDFKPPKRFMEEPSLSGPYKGQRITEEELNKMLDEYYELRGWDVKTGIPTKEKLEELGLKDVIKELGKIDLKKS